MMAEEVTLLGAWFSPYVKKVVWALKRKGVEYKYVEEDVRQKSDLLLRSNPVHRLVPVLLHRGRPIAESLVILEYIDDTWKHDPLLPADPHARATARFWAKFANDQVGEVFRQVLQSRGEQQAEAVERARGALEVLEGELGRRGTKFFGGEAGMGLEDVVLGWMPFYVEAIEEASAAAEAVFHPRSFPVLSRWMKDFSELPLIQQNPAPPKAELVPFFEFIRRVRAPPVAEA